MGFYYLEGIVKTKETQEVHPPQEANLPQKRQLPSSPRLVAIIGAKATGKDVLVHYLVEHYGAQAFEVGAFARKLVTEVEENEPHLQYDTSAKNLAHLGVEYVMIRLVAAIINLINKQEQLPKVLVITGVRTPTEAAVLKTHFGSDLLLVYIKGGSEETRYARIQSRSLPTDPHNFQDFRQQDASLKSVYRVTETAVLADVTLWNKGPLEAYYQQIERYVVPHLFPQTNTHIGGIG